MAMKSLAREYPKMLECAPSMPARISYPCFYVDSKQMPEIDSWEVGQEYVITVKVKMVSYSLDENMEKESQSNASLDVIEYATKAPKSLN